MSSLQEGDDQAAEVQKTPFRVTLASMENKVVSIDVWHPPFAPHMTVAAVELENGFILIGKSAPADPGNFDAELGKKFAVDDALRQMWPLEDYLLCEKLSIEEMKSVLPAKGSKGE